MTEEKIKKRHRVRKKDVSAIEKEFIEAIGISPVRQDSRVDIAQTERYTVVMDNDTIIGVYFNDRLFPTVRGLLSLPPVSKYVTVDMGAVKFVVNGADIMSPGIVDADPKIGVDDIVWIRDEKNGRPIAVGTALMRGDEMVDSDRGKAVKNLHYVGDEIWTIGQPQVSSI